MANPGDRRGEPWGGPAARSGSWAERSVWGQCSVQLQGSLCHPGGGFVVFVPLSQQNESLQTDPCWRAEGLVQPPHVWEGSGLRAVDGVRSHHACDSAVLSSAPWGTSALATSFFPRRALRCPPGWKAQSGQDTPRPFRQMSTLLLVSLTEERSESARGGGAGARRCHLVFLVPFKPQTWTLDSKHRGWPPFSPCGH